MVLIQTFELTKIKMANMPLVSENSFCDVVPLVTTGVAKF